jgi:sarcosine oxidase
VKKVKTAFDYIVIGAGAAGSSATYHLAKRGLSVLLLEQFGFAHDQGSSHGHSRIFRYAYDQLVYARMAVRALELWRELEQEAGTQLYWPTSMIDFGAPDAAKMTRVEAVLREISEPFEVMDAAGMAGRFPQWRPRADWKMIYSETGGIVQPTLTLEVLHALARMHGATLLEHTPVVQLDLSDPKAPALQTKWGKFTTAKLIITAGAWLPKLVPALAARFVVQDNLTAFFRPKNLSDFAPERFPVFIQRDDEQVYGFPWFGLPGIKVAFHKTGLHVNPDERTVEPTDARIEQLHAWLERYLPDAAGPFMSAKTCLYTNTATENFILDYHPQSPQIILMSPCSGHGFKFTPVLGEMLADMATGTANPFVAEPKFRISASTEESGV